MSKIQALRDMVANMFQNATEKGQIENLAKINNGIDEVEKEQKELTEKNTELIKSYKELIKHTSFKEQPKEEAQPSNEAPSFEEALLQFQASHKEETK